MFVVMRHPRPHRPERAKHRMISLVTVIALTVALVAFGVVTAPAPAEAAPTTDTAVAPAAAESQQEG